MRKTLITVLVTVVLIETLAFIIAYEPKRLDMSAFGVINALFTVIAFIAGIISVAADKTSEVGKGILIASGILLIIGISVCSNGIGK